MLRVERLSKRFGDREVLRSIELQVDGGEIFGLLGGNGAGKSTAVSIIAGTLAPDTGEVTVRGTRLPRERRRWIGVAPQEIALYPSLTCEENLRFFGKLYGLRRRALVEHVERTIQATHVDEYRGARVETLSGGWRRRLNLGVALVHAPPLLLLDEPTAGLDVDARQAVWRLIAGLARAGTAILLTTHLLDEAEFLCDRVAIMVDGRIARHGTLPELRALVPARQVALVTSSDDDRVRQRARALGIDVRDYADQPGLLLEEESTVASLIERLGDVELRSISLEPVSLLHAYLEVTGRVRDPFSDVGPKRSY